MRALLHFLFVLATVVLVKGEYDGQVRIVPSGANPYRGRLEVFHNWQWGTVCDDRFGHESAQVACRQLGLEGGWRVGAYDQYGFCRNVDGRFMCGSGPIWMDDVGCVGTESRLKDCRRTPWGWHNCVHAEDMIIQCLPPPLWNIEWEFEDQPDQPSFVSGTVAHYGLALKRVASPNVLAKCFPAWKAEGKLKIMVYTDDYLEPENPSSLPAQIHPYSWLIGWLRKPWAIPNVIFDVPQHHCDMERIRGVACAGYEVAPDIPMSWCWESTPNPPQGYLVQEAAAVINRSATVPSDTVSSPHAVAWTIATSVVQQNPNAYLHEMGIF
eukprot:c7261_g1_i1.p1 GENE.c7261_g1_i1~~c7261_g1_i1.p1  ORF type:complete len:341 (+),score=65.37 c7261_g1_i1:50-1024(+)